MGVGEEDQGDGCHGHHQTPLLQSTSFSSSSSSLVGPLRPPIIRTGTIWTAVAHIITGVIGSGILSLAWSTAQLGWVAGPLSMLVCACITLTCKYLLCDCYKSPDPDYGPTTNGSYLEAVQMILGKKSGWVFRMLIQFNLFKIGIIYTVTSAISMRAIYRSNCYHKEGHEAPCEYGSNSFMLVFGFVEMLVSQIPDFRNTLWLSIIAAVMSFSYSIIGSVLSLAKIIGNGELKGSIGGMPSSSPLEKMWSVGQALGDLAFGFPFPSIFFEIMDTLRSPPQEKVTMKKASTLAVCITTFFYLCCGGLGYAAFGNSTPGNLLTGFGFYEPYWLVDFANACIVLHLVGGYQVFSQPQFAMVERWLAKKYPDSGFLNEDYYLKLPLVPVLRLNFLRLVFRTAYVASTTVIGMIFPYFNQVIGFGGAINFWPAVVYFPVEMYIVQKNIRAWTKKWLALQIYSFVCLLVSIFALVGSIKGLITAKFS